MSTLFLLFDKSGVTTDKVLVIEPGQSYTSVSNAKDAALRAGLPEPEIEGIAQCDFDSGFIKLAEYGRAFKG
jgi:hypothetical protein